MADFMTDAYVLLRKTLSTPWEESIWLNFSGSVFTLKYGQWGVPICQEKYMCGQSYHFTLGVLCLPSGQPAVQAFKMRKLKKKSER